MSTNETPETSAPPAGPKVFKSDGPASLTLTAYESGPAVIREVRKLSLTSGICRIYIGGLPKQFVQNSQSVTGVTGSGKFKVRQRSLRPANMTFPALLAQSIGKSIVLLEDVPNSSTPRRTEGVLKTIVDNRYAVLETTGAADEQARVGEKS